MFPIILKIDKDYFPKQYKPGGQCKGNRVYFRAVEPEILNIVYVNFRLI